jgi:hypothetical protein
MAEPAAGSDNPRIRFQGIPVDYLVMDRVGHYGFVGNVEGYHRLGHGCIQNDLGGLSCPRELLQ